MNICLVVHSQTGNTRSVADRLLAELEESGHTAVVFDVKPSGGSEQKPETIVFDDPPSLEGYQGFVFAAPVHGFSLSPVMAAFMKTLPPLGGRTSACFVTQAFPFAWMGGNRAVRQLCRLCEERGASVRGTGVVNWGRSCRERLVSSTAGRLSALF